MPSSTINELKEIFKIDNLNNFNNNNNKFKAEQYGEPKLKNNENNWRWC